MSEPEINDTIDTILSEFDVDGEEMADCLRGIDRTLERMFDDYDIELADEAKATVQAYLLDHTLDMMRNHDFDDNDDEENADTPEEHFERIRDEMVAVEKPARHNVNFILGVVRAHVEEGHPVYTFVNKKMREKYGDSE